MLPLELGLDPIFTLVGDHLNEVLAAAARAGMRVVDMRHESGVTHAADAWARIHRRPALSLVTGGPGHTNSLTGVATAQLAGSPLIAVSGSRARGLADRQAFQDIDQVGMTRPIAKWAAEVPSAQEIPFYLSRAYSEANSGRRGAAHLTIPVDAFTGSATGATPRSDEPGAAASLPRRETSDGTAARCQAAGGDCGKRNLVERSGAGVAGIRRAYADPLVYDHDGARHGARRSSALHGLRRPGAELRGPYGVPRGGPVSGSRQAHRLPAGIGRRAAVSGGSRNSFRSISTRRNWE